MATGIIMAGLLNACTVGPDYARPAVETPQHYKEEELAPTPSGVHWHIANPAREPAQGEWWKIYRDPKLNLLAEQVSISNQNVIAAEAQLRQARALVQQARAGFFPTITGGPSITRTQQSSTLGARPVARIPLTDYSLGADLTWEIDLWGRIRRTVEASRASFAASAADLAAVRLTLQAELATDYFQLRGLDAQSQLYADTLKAYRRALDITTNRYNAGIASKGDVAQAETQLKTTQAQATDIRLQRTQLEHAIAVLVNKPPAEFSLPFAPLTTVPVMLPVSIPSLLLERRPDIAAAERRVAAANAQIGVARAAYFPSLTLSASGGLETTNLAKWLAASSSRFWSLGAAANQTLFKGGALHALEDQARAVYEQTVANYRGTVLTAFQEVEDNLAALRILAEESAAQEQAVKAAVASLNIIQNQYLAGIVGYLNVYTIQTTVLTNQRTAVNLAQRRMAASVALVKAMGGGWQK